MPETAIAAELMEVIRKRWSPVVFSTQAVEQEKLHTVLEAARWAPSSYNEQPWSFILARKEDTEDFARMASCLVAGNAVWAQHVPVLILSVAKRQFDRSQQPNRHAAHDVGMATAFLMLQATALGLSTHAMAGFDADKARQVLGIPETHEAVATIALGYHGDDANAPEELRKRNQRKSRRALDQLVFRGHWGQPWISN